MPSGTFSIARGRVNGYIDRIKANDPANSALVLLVLSAAEATSVLEDYDDLATLLGAAGNTEVTNGGYARKTVTDADANLAVIVDKPNDRNLGDFSDQNWAAIAAGDTWTMLLVCYDSDTTSGTDSNIVPLTWHDYPHTPNGSDIPLALPTTGFFLARKP